MITSTNFHNVFTVKFRKDV